MYSKKKNFFRESQRPSKVGLFLIPNLISLVSSTRFQTRCMVVLVTGTPTITDGGEQVLAVENISYTKNGILTSYGFRA